MARSLLTVTRVSEDTRLDPKTMTTPSKRLNLAGSEMFSDDLMLADRMPPPRQVAKALRMRECPADRVFDRFLPQEVRVVSRQYWTPLVVALRAAEWLDELDVRTMVDIGSGAGKFCVATALAGGVRFTGLEQRPRLVAVAQELARVFDIDDRVEFIPGMFGAGPVPVADAYYLFNPFGENLFGADEQLDGDVELSEARYNRDIDAVERMLADAVVGTYLLTYNGFGGEIPSNYVEVRVDREMPNILRMWQKTSKKATGAGHFSDQLSF